ncbi:hypothetical protein ABIB95_008749, partial [Bradyrhizobium sp. LA2.1]
GDPSQLSMPKNESPENTSNSRIKDRDFLTQ